MSFDVCLEFKFKFKGNFVRFWAVKTLFIIKPFSFCFVFNSNLLESWKVGPNSWTTKWKWKKRRCSVQICFIIIKFNLKKFLQFFLMLIFKKRGYLNQQNRLPIQGMFLCFKIFIHTPFLVYFHQILWIIKSCELSLKSEWNTIGCNFWL